MGADRTQTVMVPLTDRLPSTLRAHLRSRYRRRKHDVAKAVLRELWVDFWPGDRGCHDPESFLSASNPRELPNPPNLASVAASTTGDGRGYLNEVSQLNAPSELGHVPDHFAQQIDSLGYVGSRRHLALMPSDRGPDPKDRIALFNARIAESDCGSPLRRSSTMVRGFTACLWPTRAPWSRRSPAACSPEVRPPPPRRSARRRAP